MLAVLLTVHLIACLALVIAVLLQRSEGGALGMGGGGTGGLISGRGAASALVRVTMILAAVFFVTSITMTRLNAEDAAAPTDIEKAIEQTGTGDFNSLGATPAAPPASTAAPAPATPDPLAPAMPPPASAAPTTTPPASTTPTQPAPATADPLSPAAPNQ